MFDFDVVTGPSDLAKLERSEARRPPPAPPAVATPVRSPTVPEQPPLAGEPACAPGSVSGIVGDQTPGYSGARPA
ncbi:MAG TPA: hypothetical protein VHT04_16685 [Stellaceae bacterium]|jgi:hypothetical protein|nr:hypothetical protein [Stellaceae bacterium]